MAGFSHEYIRYMLGGKMRASLNPLNENIINGRIRGVAAVVGCTTPRAVQDAGVINIVRELIANNVLVVATGCAAITSGKHGLLTPETMEFAGESLAEVCETIGIPPVLHLGSCVDNSRILTILSDVVGDRRPWRRHRRAARRGALPRVVQREGARDRDATRSAAGRTSSSAASARRSAASETVTDYMIDGWTETLRRQPPLHLGAAGHRRQRRST